ncbi:MAG TPA: hypothetical protein VID70_11130 [Solirubrobacteraceae bacterium]|jgi:hypothetical protein
MLFDLTGRGRRKTVKIIYSGLAAIFLLGFVGFGVGSVGGGGGGLAEIFGEGKSGGSIDYSSQVKTAKALTVAQPNNPAAWSGLIHYTMLQAGTGDNYVRTSTEEGFGPKAKPLLLQVQSAWQHYLKLTHNPYPERADEVLRVYTTPGGLSNPTEVLKLLKIKVASQPPSATLQYQLAAAAYAANKTAEGDRAAKLAIKLAPAGERTILQNYLSKAKASAAAQLHGTKTGTAPGGQTVTIPNSQVPKGATNGQTVTIPASSLPKGVVTTGSATAPAQGTAAPQTTTAPKK